jgi:exopolysaccharide production protein ExoQ
MTAHPGLSFAITDPHGNTARRSAAFWLTNLAIFIAFFLAVHEWDASQHWLKTDKDELASLKQDEASGHANRQIGFLFLGAIGITLLLRPADTALRPNPLLLFPLAMLLIWTLCSAAWSADPALTLKRQVILLCMLLAAAGFIKQFSITQLAEIVIVQTLLVLIVGIIAEVILQPVLSVSDSEYRFAGTLHPNHMGIHMSLLLLCSLFLARCRADRRFYLLAVIAIITLMMTKSRTALFSAVVGSLVYIILAYPRKRLVLILTLCIAGGIATAISAADVFSDLGHTVLMNRGTSDPTTLTGRTMIWQFALARVTDDWGRILTGFGYGGFWTPQTAHALSERAQFALSEGHNGYLDLMLQLGLPGLGLYLCCIIGALCAWIAISRRTGMPQAALAAGLICFALNHHLAESALTAPSFPTLVLWSVIGSAALRDNGAAR